MKKLLFLINKQQLNLEYISSFDYEYIDHYITYRLAPYKQLKCFRYNTIPEPFIDGIVEPDKLTLFIKEFLSRNACINLSSNISILNGFFNLTTSTCYITDYEYASICSKPENYCLFITNLFV